MRLLYGNNSTLHILNFMKSCDFFQNTVQERVPFFLARPLPGKAVFPPGGATAFLPSSGNHHLVQAL